jgi:ABC-type antimicrobial peptide transport system permease subunit
MYPTLIFGVLMLGASIKYAFQPERRFVPLLLSLGIVTTMSGLLGFTVGFITTIRFIVTMPPPEQTPTMLIGIAESSNNIVLALMGVVLCCLIAGVGALRVARSEPAS